MANEITASTTSNDQEKFLASQLLKRTMLRLVCASVCEKINQPKGTGSTAYFVRYNRMNVPVTTLTESTQPSNSTFSLTQLTVSLDQWGDVITLTDVAQLTTKHPLLQQAMELLSDNAQRVMDREVQIVWLAGTNIQYGDGSVTTRPTVTSSMKISDSVIHKARVSLVDGGASPRGGPASNGMEVAQANGSIKGSANFVGIAGPQVIGDIMAASTSLGTFASVAMYANQKALYNAEVGTWLGVRWVETNFIPKFTLLGNTTAAVADAGSGGITGFVIDAVSGSGALTASTTYYWKLTRKDLTRGFEEAISIEHTTATGASEENFTLTMPSTAGYVYNFYIGASSGDANLLKFGSGNHAASESVDVNAVGTGAAAPAAVVAAGGTGITIHPVYIHGAESCCWVGLQNLEMFVTKDESIIGNVLKQQRALGYKFMGKALIKNQSFMIRLEVASTY